MGSDLSCSFELAVKLVFCDHVDVQKMSLFCSPKQGCVVVVHDFGVVVILFFLSFSEFHHEEGNANHTWKQMVSCSREMYYQLPLASMIAWLLCFGWQVKRVSVTRLCRQKSILTVNGQFPGPTIRARKGDVVVVNVRNHGDKNITIHWFVQIMSQPIVHGVVGVHALMV